MAHLTAVSHDILRRVGPRRLAPRPKSPTAVHSGLNDPSATAAELERLAEQLRAPAGAR